jgi:hypothetical protein
VVPKANQPFFKNLIETTALAWTTSRSCSAGG